MEIGHKIRKVRELKDFTQEYMAEKMGITQPSYSKYEKENGDLTISQLNKIAEIFNMKPEELMTFDEKLVFNNCNGTNSSYGVNSGINYNGLGEREKELYEKTIKLLEDKINFLEKIYKN